MEKERIHIDRKQKRSMKPYIWGGIAALLMAAAAAGCGDARRTEETLDGTAAEMEILSEAADERSESETAQTGDETGAAEHAALGTQERSAEELALIEKLQSAAGKEIALFDCADFDGDGRSEAFAVVGSRNQDVITGAIWFVGENSAAVNLTAADGGGQDDGLCLQAFSEIHEMPDGKRFWKTETFGGSATTSLIWGVEEGKARENVLSGKGSRFEETKDGEFLLYQSGLDAYTDGTGRTMKPCYFFYEDGEFHEYGAISLSQADLMEIPGFEEVIRFYEEKGFWNRRILLRGNGMVQVSLQNSSDNCYVTLAMKDGRLEIVEEGEGLAGLLIGGIEDRTWRGAEDALKAVWDEAAKENPGISVRIYPDEKIYYDLDGDGRLETIRYREKGSAEDFVDGLTVFIDEEEVWKNTEEMAEWCRMYLTDLDSFDGKQELIAEYCSANDVVVSVKFLQYENGKMREIFDLYETESMRESGFIRYQRGGAPEGFGPFIPGDNTVTAWVDTPFWRDGFGSYYIKIRWKYDGGVLTEVQSEENEVKSEEYRLRSMFDGQPWPYKPVVPVTIFGEAECLTPVYEACPGEILYAAALRAPAGEGDPLCIRVEVAGTDIAGWIAVGDDRIFEEIPAWG